MILPLELELLKQLELAEPTVSFHSVVTESEIQVKTVTMATNFLVMDVPPTVLLNVEMVFLTLENNVMLEQQSTTKDSLMDADLAVFHSFVEMASEMLMKLAITEPPIPILFEMPVEPTVSLLSVVTVSSITVNNAILLTMLFVPPTVLQLSPLAVTEF